MYQSYKNKGLYRLIKLTFNKKYSPALQRLLLNHIWRMSKLEPIGVSNSGEYYILKVETRVLLYSATDPPITEEEQDTDATMAEKKTSPPEIKTADQETQTGSPGENQAYRAKRQQATNIRGSLAAKVFQEMKPFLLQYWKDICDERNHTDGPQPSKR